VPRLAAVVTLVVLGTWRSSALAQNTYLQTYESGLADPFNLQPSYSGSSEGFDGASSPITLVTNDGAAGTSQSASLTITDTDGAATAGGHAGWQVRLLPNSGGARTGPNIGFNPDGFVGFWMKVPATVVPEIKVSPSLEDSTTTTATNGVLKTVLKDGLWHLYEWNMDNPADFPLAWKDVYDNGSSLGDTALNGTQSFDSIAIVSDSPFDASATLQIDQIGFNNAGSMAVPEPTGIATLTLGFAAAFGVSRRRKR
jgi:hypothetical protein